MQATWFCSALVFSLGTVLWGQTFASEPVRQAELAFAKQGSEQGIRKAFLAWSMGPWTYAVKRGEAPIVHGHFLSLWEKQSDGSWRVLADIGVPHAAPAGGGGAGAAAGFRVARY